MALIQKVDGYPVGPKTFIYSATPTVAAAMADGVQVGDILIINGLVHTLDQTQTITEPGQGNARLDFTGTVLDSGERLIRASSVDFEAVTGWMAFSGNTTTGFRYAAYFQPTTDGDAVMLGVGSIVELLSGATVKTAECAQLIVQVDSGATVASRAGDATAGIHPVWAKINGDAGATWASGCRVAPLWADIQIAGANPGSESYFLLATTENNITAIIRHESTAATSYLLQTDQGGGNGFIAAQGVAADVSGTQQTLNLAVDINGTTYYIPLMAAA